jgi:uncharacterized membrane protein
MKTLRKMHLYLGCVFSPMLILFAMTGAAQMFGIHFGILSEVHLRHYGSWPFILLSILMGLSVVITAILGIVMALRFGGSKKPVWVCLALGVVVPVVLLMMSHNLGKSKRQSVVSQRTEAQGSQ